MENAPGLVVKTLYKSDDLSWHTNIEHKLRRYRVLCKELDVVHYTRKLNKNNSKLETSNSCKLRRRAITKSTTIFLYEL